MLDTVIAARYCLVMPDQSRTADIAQLDCAIVAVQARMHDIGGTREELDAVNALVRERDALLAIQRREARRARRVAA